MKKILFYLILLMVSVLFEDCSRKSDLDSAPYIEFISFRRDTEHSRDYIVFSFTDKEGDLGNFVTSRTCNGNIFFTLLEKLTDGTYQKMPDHEPCFLVTGISTEQERATQGFIEVAYEHLAYPPATLVPILKFQIQIEDMAGNKSNIIETPDIDVPTGN